MNKLTITGNLTALPELRTTPSGKNVANFTVAVNSRRNGEQETTFFRVTAWDKLAENCKHYLQKGSKVLVIGAVGCDSYKTSDGTFRAALTVNASEVEFLSSKRDEEREAPSAQEPFPVDTPADLPF